MGIFKKREKKVRKVGENVNRNKSSHQLSYVRDLSLEHHQLATKQGEHLKQPCLMELMIYTSPL